MQFGVQFFPAVAPEDKSASDYFAECLAIAAEAETLGYSHARTVEHYFRRYGGYSPNPLLFLAAASQRTKKMRLVTGAVVPAFNNPLKLAGEIAMLDAISQGRLDVGFARAFLPHEFRRFNISPDESVARFREGVEQIGAVADDGARHPSRAVPLLRRSHLAAAADAKTAAEILRRLDAHAGVLRVCRARRPCADGDPDRTAQAAARSLSQRLARRRPSRRRRGDDRLPYVLPRGRARRARHSAPRLRSLFRGFSRIRRRMDARHDVEGLPGLRQVDRPHEGLFAGEPDRDRQCLCRHARRDQRRSSGAFRKRSENSSTLRCKSISARWILPKRKNRCGCSPAR